MHKNNQEGLVGIDKILKKWYRRLFFKALKRRMEKGLKQGQKTPPVAIMGHRGIPNSYGGFETLAEELAKSLVGFGSSVTVYCRKNYFAKRPAEYHGAALVYLPTIPTKNFDTPVHSLLSVLHCLIKNTAKVIIMVNVGNAPFALLAKLFGKKVILCVDGLDWQRKKWGSAARAYFKVCSYLAKWACHEVVTDAGSVQEFYRRHRQTNSTHIPYGTDITIESGDGALLEYGLTRKKYFIYVARFEPENNPLLVVRAHKASGSPYPLVMIGDNRYNPEYVREIKAAAGGNVLFLGYVFGAKYKELLKNALCYVRAAEVGGLSPAVIEAMGRGVCVIANDKPENREPLGQTGIFYPLRSEELAKQFVFASTFPDLVLDLGKKTAERAMILYNWDRVSYEYFKLIKKLAKTRLAASDEARPAAGGQKRLLITGAGGMLGAAMYEHFKEKWIVKATSRHANESWISVLDVQARGAFERAVKSFRPDVILHLAALTNLEECEKNVAETYAVNTLPVKYAAQLASLYGAKLVYISTANVFDGSHSSYGDTDEARPGNIYGLTKHMGALMAEYYAQNFLTLRLGWLIGGGPLKDKKFVAKIIEQIMAGKTELNALTDKSGSISYTRDVARNLERLLLADCRGTYNMASSGFATRFDVAKEIVRQLGFSESVSVSGVDSNFFSHTFTTARSSSECLRSDRLERENQSLQRPWQDALKDYLERDFAYAKATAAVKTAAHALPAM